MKNQFLRSSFYVIYSSKKNYLKVYLFLEGYYTVEMNIIHSFIIKKIIKFSQIVFIKPITDDIIKN